jgi:hypothetical protein
MTQVAREYVKCRIQHCDNPTLPFPRKEMGERVRHHRRRTTRAPIVQQAGQPIGYALGSLIIIPLVVFGMTLLAKLQVWTQPSWLLMLFSPPVAALTVDPGAIHNWVNFAGSSPSKAGFDPLLFGTAAAGFTAKVSCRHRVVVGAPGSARGRDRSRVPPFPGMACISGFPTRTGQVMIPPERPMGRAAHA